MSGRKRGSDGRKSSGYERRAKDVMVWAKSARALASAVVAVGAAWAAANHGCGPPPTEECLEVESEHVAHTITFSQWRATEFRLIGKNACGRELTVHVAFFALSESFRFQPPAGCPTENPMMNDPECWAVQTVNEGDVDWGFFPPALHPLGNPPGSGGGEDTENREVRINMRWVVYADQTDIVDAQTEQILMLDDRVPG